MHKSTGEVCDPQRVVILVLSLCFACTKPQVRSGTHRDLYSCGGKHAVMCKHKYTDEVWDT